MRAKLQGEVLQGQKEKVLAIRFSRDQITQSNILLRDRLWNMKFVDLQYVAWLFRNSLYLKYIYKMYYKYADNNNADYICCIFN